MGRASGRAGAELLAARLELVDALRPHVARHYADVAQSVPKADGGNDAGLELQAVARARAATTARATSSTPRCWPRWRDAATTSSTEGSRSSVRIATTWCCRSGPLPAKGYASHGESWSFALALRLAAFELLRADGDDPVLILDDVFAELDDLRRARLAELVAGTEQVLVTAAVPADVPAELVAHRFDVRDGAVTRA